MKLDDFRQGVGALRDGAFLRTVPLPTAVKGDKARARYRGGVLWVELPELSPGKPSVKEVRIN